MNKCVWCVMVCWSTLWAASAISTETTGVVSFQAGSPAVEPGSAVSVPVTVAGFTNVTTVQFTLQWDSAVLQYLGTTNFALSNLDTNNFGTNHTAAGRLTFSWDALAADTERDGTPIFDVQFLAIGTNEASAAIGFIDRPTLREVTTNLVVAAFQTQDALVSLRYLPPVIVTGPQNQTVVAGDSAAFSVTATSTPPLGYQWFYDGNPLRGQTGATLALTNVQPSNAGPYAVVVSNVTASVTSAVAVLNVRVPPLLTVPSEQTMDQLMTLVVTNLASTPNRPANPLTFGLVSGPTGANLDPATGILTWTPAASPLPSTNTMVVEVTEAGTPPLSTSNSFDVVVTNALRTIAGTIQYYSTNLALTGAVVNLAGDDAQSTTTDALGNYRFTVKAPGNYTVGPALTTDNPPYQGASALDLNLIRRQILDLEPLPSPYAVIAADANGDHRVSTLDIAYLRRLILGTFTTLPAGLWKFVPADFQSTNSAFPWDYVQTHQFTSLTTNVSGLNFLGIKVGDVNGDWAPPPATLTGLAATGKRGGQLKLRQISSARVTFGVADQSATAGSCVQVPITVRGFDKVTSVQFTLQWDPAVLQFSRVIPGSLVGVADENFGPRGLSRGNLTFAWDDPAGVGVTLPDGTVAFTLDLNVIGHAGSSTLLSFADQPTPRQVSVGSLLANLVLQAGKITFLSSPASDRTLPTAAVLDAAGGMFRLSVPSDRGRTYTLEGTTSLLVPSWRPVQQLTGDGNTIVLSDPIAVNSSRFYRLRIQ